MNSWQEYKGDHTQLTMAIQAISKSDSWHLRKTDRIQRRGRAAPGAADVRLEASYLHLQGELPPLLTASDLSFRGALHVRQLPGKPSRPCCPRLLSGETITRITKACTRVRDAAAELSDKESKNLVLRNAERSGKHKSTHGFVPLSCLTPASICKESDRCAGERDSAQVELPWRRTGKTLFQSASYPLR